ncbi:signal transduction protein [Lipomyces kononenkoae]|uniref:Signal transduction protein n=1 Tax=Lipomyces kononenkoae TaxID=34357 RepID=A0ACC3T6A8_LIPKO
MQALENLFAFGQSQSQQIYGNNYTPEEHRAKFSHEAIAGAASFEAFKLFEDRQRREGKPVSHAFAKELLMGIAGAEVDKLIETKGLDFYDRERAKRHAYEQVNQMYDSHYGQLDCYDPMAQAMPYQLQGYGGYGGNREVYGYEQVQYGGGEYEGHKHHHHRHHSGEFRDGYDDRRW